MKLFYFTASYPFGLGEQWKANELIELANNFEEITVVPYSYAGNFDSPRKLPPGVQLKGPLFRGEGRLLGKKDILKAVFHKKALLFFREFFKKKVYRNRKHLISWLQATINSIELLKHPVIKDLIGLADKETVLYFFWGRGSCEFLPFIDTTRYNKIFVRMHRYDLFEEESSDYIPYRSSLLQAATRIAPTSEVGRSYLKRLYPNYSDKIYSQRLGIRWNGKIAKPSDGRQLKVVSCSYLSPVKRVHLMVACLQYVEVPITWHHVGDGALRDEIENLIVSTGVEGKFILEGALPPEEVLNYYSDHNFDVFVNVSSSEGIPISIMEALSLGIPVMATDVGGTREIVNEEVGRLLPPDVTPEQLALQLNAYYRLSLEEKESIRRNAHQQCIDGWEVQNLSKDLVSYLKS